ncbi:class I SAM-dependent methyltransferase [Sulfurirhabdus autotrophica]|uniref:SAM-dependent MidA family methyltransferase n=1 Tax=Sulfurirhabdus autotrophica TaxID=1706046 RepID=A0A4R3Y4R6_9PROT|nr:SAM-dependent methyltransferase [Sulfurirhabdus autotrophica]TCV85113.1 SAM-dependent MidA family methyltransferase [Sulfurirhabdus autotrophica]
MAHLPEPTPEALIHSQQLANLIQAEIENNHNWISFARYMELALYAPGLGYYSAGASKFGHSGDFVTAPEISSLFGRTLARQVSQILRMTDGDILETGAGTGALAFQLLSELAKLNSLPSHYYILEVSADLQERQRSYLQQKLPYLVDRVEWLNQLPSAFSGVILGNEVLDAMPVHLVAWRENGLYERGVTLQNNRFAWREHPLTTGRLFETVSKLIVPNGYVSEINLAAQGFIASLAQILQQGIILMIDYGFGESEYYHPQRSEGTLMCHYRHHAHAEPFYLPGLQDITAHVDFSAIALAGISNGLQLLGYTTQASFLINSGITDVLSETSPENASIYLPLANQAQKLLSPSEMGELFKVIALGKNISDRLIGFTMGDKSRLL